MQTFLLFRIRENCIKKADFIDDVNKLCYTHNKKADGEEITWNSQNY